MKIYTQEEYDALQRNEKGFKICPSGDYSQIKNIGSEWGMIYRDAFSMSSIFSENCSVHGYCSFGSDCIFGTKCSFGENCDFSAGCSFEQGCKFGIQTEFVEGMCNFGSGCEFGEDCDFKNSCTFGQGCEFSYRCNFGDTCTFAQNCRFKSGCNFGEDCSFAPGCFFDKDGRYNFEGGRVINGNFFACDRIGGEQTAIYFFKGDNGNFVRADSHSAYQRALFTFEEYTEKVKSTYATRIHEREYLAAIELAKIVLEIA